MFEDIIVSLDEMGVQYTENYDDSVDASTLTIDISSVDKVQLIEIIQLANASSFEFTVDESSLIITGTNGPAEAPVLDTPEEYPAEDAQEAAFAQYLEE